MYLWSWCQCITRLQHRKGNITENRANGTDYLIWPVKTTALLGTFDNRT